MKISRILAREILDSRGQPTVEVDLFLSSGVLGRAAVPSGASTGEREALELRDGDSHRYQGKGVLKACAHVVNTIAPALVGRTWEHQKQVDQVLCELDGTEYKQKLGANAVLAVSMAFAKAQALESKKSLYLHLSQSYGFSCAMPVPLMNVVNGGAHANNGLDVQEFMIVPRGFSSFKESLRAGVEVFHVLKSLLKTKGFSVAVGDEGGFAPQGCSHEEVLAWLMTSIEKAGYKPGEQIALALDVAASEFYENGLYHFEGQKISSEQLLDVYKKYVKNFPIFSIEDGMAEQDVVGWQSLTKALGHQIQLVGDDVFVTNPRILKQGIEQKIANATLIKVNQIGTLTETIDTMKLGLSAGYKNIVSHRSGETEDTFIADLAVGTGCGQIKTGSASRTDRTAKYNQLLRIEEELS